MNDCCFCFCPCTSHSPPFLSIFPISCPHIHVYTYIYVHTHTHARTHERAHTHTHTHTRTHAHTHTHTHTHTQVCMSGLPRWLLSGEVCRVNMEVFNCGQVALNSLRLTSSLSQHLLLEEVHIYTQCTYNVSQ